MRFTTHENLIDLLVGQSLYTSPDVAMRELLQNAEDACQLEQIADVNFVAEIDVRYSCTENWVEVADNGFGMDRDIFRESFTTIGASKTSSPKLQQLLARAGSANRQIGQFGIGVLSCFGVADMVEIYSRADDEAPIAFRIRDRRSDFEELPTERPYRGTTIRLQLKTGGPMRAEQVPEAVRRHVRHAHHIRIESADTGDKRVAEEHWLLKEWHPSSAVSGPSIEAGHLQLSDAWDNVNVGFDRQLVLCNAGFLVTDAAKDVLPEYALGFRGEVNVRPGALTILMTREGFQADEAWADFVRILTDHYRALVSEKFDAWLVLDFSAVEFEHRRAIQRVVFLILRTPMREVVGAEIVEYAHRLLPKVLILGEDVATDLDVLLAKAKKQPPLYVLTADQQQQVQRSFSDRGLSYTLTETIRSTSLRVSLLRANGFAVTRAERHDYGLNFGNRSQTVQIHDLDVLTQYCSSLGIPVQSVENAPDDHTRIGSSPDAEAVGSFLQLSSNLKIQSVANMTDAIISDYNGYILNPENQEVRVILRIVPEAVGNPVRKQLLEAYFALSTYEITRARETILRLVTDPNFEVKARQSTGRYFREFLSSRISHLLGREEPDSV